MSLWNAIRDRLVRFARWLWGLIRQRAGRYIAGAQKSDSSNSQRLQQQREALEDLRRGIEGETVAIGQRIAEIADQTREGTLQEQINTSLMQIIFELSQRVSALEEQVRGLRARTP